MCVLRCLRRSLSVVKYLVQPSSSQLNVSPVCRRSWAFNLEEKMIFFFFNESGNLNHKWFSWITVVVLDCYPAECSGGIWFICHCIYWQCIPLGDPTVCVTIFVGPTNSAWGWQEFWITYLGKARAILPNSVKNFAKAVRKTPHTDVGFQSACGYILHPDMIFLLIHGPGI